MASVEQIIKEVSALKASSEQLSQMISVSAQELGASANAVAALVRGSRTGADAAQALSASTQALLKSAASMITLGRTCEKCVQSMSK